MRAAEKQYEDLISFCVDYKGSDKEIMGKLLEKLVASHYYRIDQLSADD